MSQRKSGMNRCTGVLGRSAWAGRPTPRFWAPVAHLLWASVFRAY
jgi:hypothetical protein